MRIVLAEESWIDLYFVYMNDITTENTLSLNKLLFRSLSVIVIFVLLATGLYFSKDKLVQWFLFYTREPDQYEPMNSYLDSQILLTDMKFDEAIALYDGRLSKALDKETETSLKIRKAYALFARSKDGDIKEATSLLKTIANDEDQSKLFKSWAMVGLLQFYYKSRSPEVLASMRELSALSGETSVDDNALLRKVAEVSDGLSPSAFGKIFMAAPLAGEMIKPDISEDRKKDLAIEIEGLVGQSALLEAGEQWMDTPYDLMLLEHYRGLLMTAATRGGTDQSKANLYFEAAIDIAKVDPSEATTELVAYTYFYYIAHLYQYGNAEDAKSMLDEQFLAKITPNLTETSPFVLFARTAHDNPESNNYSLFKLISDNHTGFRNFWSDKFNLSFK